MTDQTPERAIVIGHDGSTLADRALQMAAKYAELLDAPLVVVRAWRVDADIPGYGRIAPNPESFEDLADAVRSSLIDECRAVLDNRPGLDVHYRAEPGAPADVLCDVSESAMALVVGSRGVGGLSGLLLGSVAARCLRQATCPVLIVREKAASALSPNLSDEEGRVIERMPTGTIVVGNDGSPESVHATAIAADFGETLRAAVMVVRCWSIDEMPHGLIWQDGYVMPFAQASDTIRKQLEGDIAHVVARHPTVQFHTAGVLGEPGETLVHLSTQASLLVTGSRGRGGFRSLLLGSVASHCASRALCPTLVVPHDRSHSANS